MIHKIIPISTPGSLEGARLITYIQEYTDKLAIRKRPLILLCPGGHLAASLGVFWYKPFLADILGLTDAQHEFIRPDGNLLKKEELI